MSICTMIGKSPNALVLVHLLTQWLVILSTARSLSNMAIYVPNCHQSSMSKRDNLHAFHKRDNTRKHSSDSNHDNTSACRDVLPGNPLALWLSNHCRHKRDIPWRSHSLLHNSLRLQALQKACKCRILRSLTGKQFGLCDSGRNRVDRASRRPQLSCPRPRQRLQRRFRRQINAVRGGDAGSHGPDVDDAAPRCRQMGEHGLGEEDDSANVEIHDRIVQLMRRFWEGGLERRPGVVDEYVDRAPERAHACFDDFLGRLAVAHVRADRDGGRPVTETIDFRDELRGCALCTGRNVCDENLSSMFNARCKSFASWFLTLAPRLASSKAMAAPIPRDAPATIATCWDRP